MSKIILIIIRNYLDLVFFLLLFLSVSLEQNSNSTILIQLKKKKRKQIWTRTIKIVYTQSIYHVNKYIYIYIYIYICTYVTSFIVYIRAFPPPHPDSELPGNCCVLLMTSMMLCILPLSLLYSLPCINF